MSPRKIDTFFTRLNGEDFVFDRPQHIYVVPSDGTVAPRKPCHLQTVPGCRFSKNRSQIESAPKTVDSQFSRGSLLLNVEMQPH
jgi:hypothetical protein